MLQTLTSHLYSVKPRFDLILWSTLACINSIFIIIIIIISPNFYFLLTPPFLLFIFSLGEKKEDNPVMGSE